MDEPRACPLLLATACIAPVSSGKWQHCQRYRFMAYRKDAGVGDVLATSEVKEDCAGMAAHQRSRAFVKQRAEPWSQVKHQQSSLAPALRPCFPRLPPPLRSLSPPSEPTRPPASSPGPPPLPPPSTLDDCDSLMSAAAHPTLAPAPTYLSTPSLPATTQLSLIVSLPHPLFFLFCCCCRPLFRPQIHPFPTFR